MCYHDGKLNDEGGAQMNFAATEDHELLRQAVREFAEKEARPSAAARDEAMEWPADLVKKMGQLGFMGVAVGGEGGGGGGRHNFFSGVNRGKGRGGGSPWGVASGKKTPVLPWGGGVFALG